MNGYTYFLALDGETGDSLWRYQTWTDDREISVISDFSGNNWDEISICHDRGSAYSGLCEVVDGLSGEQLYLTYTVYFGAMDITDTPLFTIATSSWGGETSIQAEDMLTGDTLYTIGEEFTGMGILKFVTGVAGGDLPFPILMGQYTSFRELYLICGLSGSLQDPIIYGSNVVLPLAFQESDSLWNLAVLTAESFYITEPAIISPSPGPSCDLPSTPGSDMCLLNSSNYPTPLAAVAMEGGTGSGLCTVATSWPVGISEEINHPVITNPVLLSNPGHGGILIQCNQDQMNIHVLDITGRLVKSIQMFDAEISFIPLPAGVYHIANSADFSSSIRAVVIPD